MFGSGYDQMDRNVEAGKVSKAAFAAELVVELVNRINAIERGPFVRAMATTGEAPVDRLDALEDQVHSDWLLYELKDEVVARGLQARLWTVVAFGMLETPGPATT